MREVFDFRAEIFLLACFWILSGIDPEMNRILGYFLKGSVIGVANLLFVALLWRKDRTDLKEAFSIKTHEKL